MDECEKKRKVDWGGERGMCGVVYPATTMLGIMFSKKEQPRS
jgi:hypothetical protein